MTGLNLPNIKRPQITKIGLAGLLASILYALLLTAANAATETTGVVILSYQDVGSDTRTSISTALFEKHLKELTAKKYHVLPLDKVIDAFRNGTPLPPRTIVITFSDALQSVYTQAWPRLKAAGLPFTMFVTAGQIHNTAGAYAMSWDQVREMANAGVTIGNGSYAHGHPLQMTPDKLVSDISQASALLKDKLGFIPKYYAYPYGEFSNSRSAAIKELGFDAALGEYSDVANSNTDLYQLPRFIMSERYGDMGRFKLIINAMALPVTDVVPGDPLIATNPPAFGFTLTEEIPGLGALACYPSHLSKAASLTHLGPGRIEVRFDKPFPKGASRINCTMPGPGRRWYWFGRPFFVK